MSAWHSGHSPGAVARRLGKGSSSFLNDSSQTTSRFTLWLPVCGPYLIPT